MPHLVIHLAGDFSSPAVSAYFVPSSWRPSSEIEFAIESAWDEARRRPGVLLFDGPMCRLETWSADAGTLRLALSPMTYKPFFGTNFSRPELADKHGPAALANPLGVSAALETSDGFLLLGRRNTSVAYYPGRVHSFAGSVEPPRAGEVVNVFAEVRRELSEELGLVGDDVSDVRCTGLAEDRKIRQPELIFRARATRTRAQIESTVDAAEHAALLAIPADRASIERAVLDPEMTPVAVASLLLWNHTKFGAAWLDDQLRAYGGTMKT